MKKIFASLMISAMLVMTAAASVYAGPADELGKKAEVSQEAPAYGPGQAGNVIAPIESQLPQQTGDQAPAQNPSVLPALPQQGTEQGTEQPALPQQTGGRYIDPSKPMVALTFDDGPQTSVGNQIMDVAAKYGAKVTFYLVGDRIASRAAEVQRMAAEGHEIGNHSLNHKYLQKLSAGEIVKQVEGCNDVVQNTVGFRPATMRLPGGGKNATVLANVHQPIILWNIDTLDWKTRNTASVVSSVLNSVKDGDIVLMHELYSTTGAAAEIIIPELAARGFQMVTVSEMAQAKGITLNPGQVYYSFK